MYFLYWIKYPHHTDIFTEGYVGITNNPKRRFEEHKKGHKNAHKNKQLPRAIKKGAQMEIVLGDLTMKQALEEEKKYRPVENIGWNLNSGGFIPPSKKGKKYSEGKQILKGEERTESQKNASKKHSERMKGKKPWNKGIKTPENKKPKKKCVFKGISFDSQKEAAEYFGVSSSYVSKWLKNS